MVRRPCDATRARMEGRGEGGGGGRTRGSGEGGMREAGGGDGAGVNQRRAGRSRGARAGDRASRAGRGGDRRRWSNAPGAVVVERLRRRMRRGLGNGVGVRARAERARTSRPSRPYCESLDFVRDRKLRLFGSSLPGRPSASFPTTVDFDIDCRNSRTDMDIACVRFWDSTPRPRPHDAPPAGVPPRARPARRSPRATRPSRPSREPRRTRPRPASDSGSGNGDPGPRDPRGHNPGPARPVGR